MTARRWNAIVVAFAMWLVPQAARAQATSTAAVAVRGTAFAGYEYFAASKTFDAVFESSGGPVFGGGADVVVRQRLFIRFDASRFHKTGERAFDLDGQVFRLGLPLEATIVPLTLSAGYRQPVNRRVVVYGGAGVGSWRYDEESSSSDAGENVHLHKTGFLVIGGAETRLHRWISVAGEVEYAHVPNAFAGGLAEDFKEHDLGGTTVRARLIVGR